MIEIGKQYFDARLKTLNVGKTLTMKKFSAGIPENRKS